MKKILCLVLLAVGFLSGCSDKEAREYAGKLAEVLRTYQAEVVKKIKAEQETYKDLKSTYSYARQQNVQLTVDMQRFRRRDLLADQMLKDKDFGITPSKMQELLTDYALYDFENTKELLFAEGDMLASESVDLETLKFEVQRIEALIKVLDELSKPKSDINKLRFVLF